MGVLCEYSVSMQKLIILLAVVCTTCTVVKIESTAGAAQNQPDKLGTFEYAGAMWENTVPFFKNDRGMFLTPDPSSNPVIYRLKWVVSEIIGGINAGTQNEKYTNGLHCPWDLPDSWEYMGMAFDWHIDTTLKVTCVEI